MASMHKKTKKRTILKWTGICVALTLILVFFVTKFIYDATFPRYEEFRPVPDALTGMVAQSRIVTFSDGKNELTGTYFEAQEAGKLLLFIPGYRAGADDYLWQIHAFNDAGWSVFVFEATGCDRSGGRTAVGYAQILEDTRAALAVLEEDWMRDGFAVAGHSRGAYAACLALEDERAQCAVLISGQNSAMEGIMQPAVKELGLSAYGNWPMLWLYQVMLFGEDDVDFSAAHALDETGKPVLVIQGAEDEIAPMDSFSIYAHRDEIRSSNVVYYVCNEPGKSGHTSLLFAEDGTDNKLLMEEITDFLGQQ